MKDFFMRKILNNLHFQVFLKGSFMGIADLLPGISGSTIALMLGIYHKFLQSIKNINFKSLLQFKIKEFFNPGIKFLCLLFSGIFFSLICFSKILNIFLHHEFFRPLLFSFFLGLVITSGYYLIKNIKFNLKRIIFLLFGIVISFSFCYFSGTYFELSMNLPLKLIISGLLGILAMLLPGISGSFALLPLGVYPLIVNAIADFYNLQNMKILFFLASGIIIGFLIFPRIILLLLDRYYHSVLSFLIGLMIGSVYMLWPFWNYKKIQFSDKELLVCDTFKLPQIISYEFFFSFSFVLLGFLLFFKIKQKTEEKNIKKIIK